MQGGSLLLILVAVTLLALGLSVGVSALLAGSVAASLLAAVALLVQAWQAVPATRSNRFLFGRHGRSHDH